MDKIVQSNPLIERVKNHLLTIQVESFTEDVDLVNMLDKHITDLEKMSKFSDVYQEALDSELYYDLNENSKKILNVFAMKKTTLLKMEFVLSYWQKKKVESEKIIEKILNALEKNKIPAELSYDFFFVDKYEKKTHSRKTDKPEKNDKSLKFRLYDLLWLEYGVDEIFTEEQIDKLIKTFEKANVYSFWIKRDCTTAFDDFSEK